jgi:hypothetical protein
VHRVEGFNTWKCLKVCRKECEQGFSERLEVVRKLRRIWTFEGVEGRQEAKYLESLKEGVVTRRRTSSGERHFGVRAEVLKRKRRTVGILCGEFTKSREPLDLTEEQGSYHEYS